jgi:hypothetical protein
LHGVTFQRSSPIIPPRPGNVGRIHNLRQAFGAGAIWSMTQDAADIPQNRHPFTQL